MTVNASKSDFSKVVRQVAELTGGKVEKEEATGLTYVDASPEQMINALRDLGLLKNLRISIGRLEIA